MENFKSFKDAKDFYCSTWAPERRKVMKDLRSIKDEVQRQTRIHSIGCITYASVGLVGGGLTIAGTVAAPLTLGASLPVVVAATSVTSGVARITHVAVKTGIIKSKCNEAETSLQNHEKTSRKMITLIRAFLEDIKHIIHKLPNITAGVIMLAKILSHCGEVGKSVSSVMMDVSEGAVKLSAKALRVVVAIGIIVDLGSLIFNAFDLSQMEKGKLCNEAQKLQEVIENLQEEYDAVSKLFD